MGRGGGQEERKGGQLDEDTIGGAKGVKKIRENDPGERGRGGARGQGKGDGRDERNKGRKIRCKRQKKRK